MFRQWLPDDGFRNGGITGSIPGAKINYTKKTPTYVAPEDVYATSRSMGTLNKDPRFNLNFNLTWFFTVDAGYTYLVRLHFCESQSKVTKPGQRIFSIFIGNLIASLATDVIQLSGGSWIPVYLDFSIYVGPQSGPRSDLPLDLRPYKEDHPKYYDAILNGVDILKLNDFDGNFAGRIPNSLTSPSPLTSLDLTPNHVRPSIGKGKLHVKLIILITFGSAIGLATFIVVLMLSIRQMKRKNREENSVVMFKKITMSFSHTVGKGGFGTVYGGNLYNGRKVAVKVLKDSNENGEDFINEVTSMSQTSHVNIVSLLGFSYEGSKRAIMYEFLENGSLDQFMSRNKSLTQDIMYDFGGSMMYSTMPVRSSTDEQSRGDVGRKFGCS